MFAPETFIVRAVDDGMEPRIRAGDYVCVDADKAPAVDGSVVLFGRGADAVVRRLGRGGLSEAVKRTGQALAASATGIVTRPGTRPRRGLGRRRR